MKKNKRNTVTESELADLVLSDMRQSAKCTILEGETLTVIVMLKKECSVEAASETITYTVDNKFYKFLKPKFKGVITYVKP